MIDNNIFRAELDCLKVKSGIKTKDVEFSKVNKYVTWVVLLFMPLSTYITPFEGITIGDIFLISAVFVMLICILSKNIITSEIIAVPLLLYGMFVFMHSLMFWMIKPNELRYGFLGVQRYLLYIIAVTIGAKYFFDYEYAYRVYKMLALLFALYCIIQFSFFKHFFIVLPPNVLGLPSVDYITSITSEYNISAYISGAVIFRPRSVFLEPSYYATYQIPILYLILSNENEKPLFKYGISLLITISIFLAGTSTGILLLLFCWWTPIMEELKKNFPRFILLTLITVPILVQTSRSEYIQSILRRIISEDRALGTSILGRIENYQVFFDGTLSWYNLLFGQGMWVSVGYLPSYGSIVLYFGLIGFLIFLILMIWTYLNSGDKGRAMILLMFIMFIGTNTLFNITSILMFFLIYSDYGVVKRKV